MRAVFFHKTSLQSECSCILGLPADDTGSLPELKDDNGNSTISNRPIGTSNDDVNYHCAEGKSYDTTIGISLKKTDRNNATTLLPVVAMASYLYSTLLEEIRYIPVIDAKRKCLLNYPQFQFQVFIHRVTSARRQRINHVESSHCPLIAERQARKL